MVDADDDELAARARARVGTVLRAKYRLDRVLGFGGMGAVYAATHRNGKEFAVKVLHPELSLRPDVRTRFLREGYVANTVKHAGAVAVLDDDVAEDGAAFLVMELLDGDTVEGLWARAAGKLPLALVTGMAMQLLDVLAAAHARGVVHRDIKPANLFLTTTGHLKVLDFGIARLKNWAVTDATRTGLMLGTPAFMAPEQAAGQTNAIDAQSDLWSAGATMFALASGQFVHGAENAQQIVIRTATQPAPSLASVLPDVPPSLGEVVDRALAFDKAERWANAAAMREALRSAWREVLGAVAGPESLARLAEEIVEGGTTVVWKGQRVDGDSPAPVGLAGRSADQTDTAKMSRRLRAMVARHAPPPGGSAGAEMRTVEPVSRDSFLRRKLAESSHSIAFGSVVFAISLCATVGVGVVVSRLASSGDGASRAAASPARGRAPATQPRAGRGAAAGSAAEATAAVPEVGVDSLPAASPAGAAAWSPASAQGWPRASAAPASSATPPAASAATLPPASAPSPGAPGVPGATCDPPYTHDAHGIKVWKRECFR
jgi:serine/threonine-protein kinase